MDIKFGDFFLFRHAEDGIKFPSRILQFSNGFRK